VDAVGMISRVTRYRHPACAQKEVVRIASYSVLVLLKFMIDNTFGSWQRPEHPLEL
jgi:hypothetical protein